MRVIFNIYCFLLLSTTVIRAQEAAFGFTFNHVALSVKDVNKAADFYSNVLELKEITNKTKAEGIRWFSLGDGKELHLISTIKTDVKINKAIHFALTTPTFDLFVKKLEQQNVEYSDWPGGNRKISTRADGIRQIFFQDADGNWIEVNSATPH